MIKTGFYIGKRDWWIMAYFMVDDTDDLKEVYETLLAAGCDDYKAQEVCMVLSRDNTGYTFTNLDDHVTFMFVSKASSPEQMFDSIMHEIKHLTEHVGEYYGLDPKEEMSAYLQGEVGRNLFPAVAMAICPRCYGEHFGL